MLPKIKVCVVKKNASKRQKLVTGFVIMTAMIFLWIEGTSGSVQPNLTSVETWGETQIKVTWEPFEHMDNDKPHFFELYIDDYLEYFGNDLVYVARRLTPDTIYHFKLRSCIQESRVCSLFSKTLSGTTDQSRKRGFTKSFFQWTLLCLVVTVFASTTALLGTKITRRLWRSFLYRYDYRSETNLQGPKYVASTDAIDEDLMTSLCLKTVSNIDGSILTADLEICELKEEISIKNRDAKENRVITYQERLENGMKRRKVPLNIVGNALVNESQFENVQLPTEVSDSVFQNYENVRKLPTDGKDLKILDEQLESLRHKDIPKDMLYLENSKEKLATCTTDLSTLKMDYDLTNNNRNKDKLSEGKQSPMLPRNRKTGHAKLTIERAHTNPKITRGLNSKKGHRRAFSFDGNIQRKRDELPEKIQNVKDTHSIPKVVGVEDSSDVVVVVDNSNIFIGAQECATLLNPNQRKRNIRVKIQQLVKVFQRGRIVARAFVQGSSPPTTEQVWEVYRRLGYSVDLEDRRGKDEQRVDEGLHLHIYKALFELSPRTLVVASGDGNKGKSECATSLPGCAEAAIEGGWRVEVYSWQHSTSMEWLKLYRKYPEQLTIHYLDRYLKHITFVDGKYGRKCQPFPTDFFKSMNKHQTNLKEN